MAAGSRTRSTRPCSMMAAVSALMVGVTAIAMIVLDRLYGLDKVLVGQH